MVQYAEELEAQQISIPYGAYGGGGLPGQTSLSSDILNTRTLFKELRRSLRAEYYDEAVQEWKCDDRFALVSETGYRELIFVINMCGGNLIGLMSNYPDKERWAQRIAERIQYELIDRLTFNYKDWGVKKEKRGIIVWTVGLWIFGAVLAATQGHLAKTVSRTTTEHQIKQITESPPSGGIKIPFFGGK